MYKYWISYGLGHRVKFIDHDQEVEKVEKMIMWGATKIELCQK